MLAVRATNLDRPALCGVDVLLRMELGTDYARANHGTWYAAYAVAGLMREMGYVEAGTAKCSPDCVAGQGIVWETKGVHDTGMTGDIIAQSSEIRPADFSPLQGQSSQSNRFSRS